jgi:hypothetical protein
MKEVLGFMDDEAGGFVGTGGDGAECDTEHSADAECSEGLDRVIFNGGETDEGRGGVRFGLRVMVLQVRGHTGALFKWWIPGGCREIRTDWAFYQARPALGLRETFPYEHKNDVSCLSANHSRCH